MPQALRGRPIPGVPLSLRARIPLLLWLALLALAAALFVGLDLGRMLDLAWLQSTRHDLQQRYAQQPLLGLALFALLYITSFVLLLPAGTLLNLAAGAVFGFWAGVLVVSFSGALGATAAFLLGRHALGDWVRTHAARPLAKIDRGIARDGVLYLFTLRLVPLFPPPYLSLLFGLSTMRVRTFYAVSQLGMLAGTVLYVNAGTQLAQLQSVRDVLSPSVLASLAALGLFPWLARQLVARLRGRYEGGS